MNPADSTAIDKAPYQERHPASQTVIDPLMKEADSLLEHGRIRELAASEARFYMSREAILSSLPSRHPEDVFRLQEETSEAREMLREVGDIGLSGMQDPREPLRRAMLGGILKGSELLLLCAVFDSVWTARAAVEKMGIDTPRLNRMARDIHDLRPLSRQVAVALSEAGNVLDSATPRLGESRSRARRSYQRAMRIMDDLANDPQLSTFLQSNAVASRNDRLVLEVKSSQRQFVPGIIHDVSGSGQTIFVEPFRVVDAANDWRAASSAALHEENRVLRQLTRSIAARGDDALASLHAAANLDAVVARGRLAIKMSAVRPDSSSYGDSGVDDHISLNQAKHPLLGEDAVPVSIQLDSGCRGLVITGPNTGGKTVAMKTLGLMALMHQSGMQIPAAESSFLPVFDGVYADIGDAQSIDRSVSTFSSHMARVVRIIRRANQRSLVLLDELGTGTDPEEGSALARAILGYLVSQGVWTCVTTHHRQVAEFAETHDALQNSSVELDPDTMLPNYRLISGVPGQSYAMNVASRLGVPASVLSDAEAMLDPARSQVEELLKNMQKDRDAMRDAQQESVREQAENARLKREAGELLSAARRERESMVEAAREQLIQEAQHIRRQLRRLMREAKGKQSWESGRQSAKALIHSLRSEEWLENSNARRQNKLDSPRSDGGANSAPIFALGDEVKLEKLGLSGKIVELGADGSAVVLAGAMRLQARRHMMTLVRSAQEAENHGKVSTIRSVPSIAELHKSSGDLDIRGSRVHNIESMVPQFIDRAFMQGLKSVRIIHGEGSGALRDAVRELLAREPSVEGFRSAPADQGGNSITVAILE